MEGSEMYQAFHQWNEYVEICPRNLGIVLHNYSGKPLNELFNLKEFNLRNELD